MTEKKGFNEELLKYVRDFEKLPKEEQDERMERVMEKLNRYLEKKGEEYREEQRLLRLRKNKRYTL